MANSNSIIAGVGLADAPRKSRLPARIDWMQSATGLILALFMWGHMFFVSSILISNDAMWTITKFVRRLLLLRPALPGNRLGASCSGSSSCSSPTRSSPCASCRSTIGSGGCIAVT